MSAPWSFPPSSLLPPWPLGAPQRGWGAGGQPLWEAAASEGVCVKDQRCGYASGVILFACLYLFTHEHSALTSSQVSTSEPFQRSLTA